MQSKKFIDNELVIDGSSVWLLQGHEGFSYSDGTESEHYLEEVLREAVDLSSSSEELEASIRDWISEYHLSSKRAQLLSGFNFERSMSVLEVGCGCGAITRFLGETFEQVISIEGSISRARIARLRTRDLESVSVVCGPFQEIKFSKKFDIVFCIGVYEYSGSFVGGPNPYDAVLAYLNSILAPGGILVLAIENQFGLKYFNGAQEDHLGKRFVGLEGYHRISEGVRTFGKTELENNLKKHFENVQFYYPFPDYKLPSCIVNEEFMLSGKAGEIISQVESRNGPSNQSLWDEYSVIHELSKNKALDFFSNSFLVVAGKGKPDRLQFDQRAIMFSSGRRKLFSTKTKVLFTSNKSSVVSKTSRWSIGGNELENLKMVDCDSPWVDQASIFTAISFRARRQGLSLDEIFSPCKPWLEYLEKNLIMINGARVLDGGHIDTIWSNVYMVAEGCMVVDREWVWKDHVPLNVVVIRAIYHFIMKVDSWRYCATPLRQRSGIRLISAIGQAVGVKLDADDFKLFVEIESDFQSLVRGIAKRKIEINIRWYLSDRVTFNYSNRMKAYWRHFSNIIRRKLFGLRGFLALNKP
ncbi:MAG: class I SAM-dependent methyltransferase [Candidatus Dechloromonas phosphoritropha]|jgi:SAM-dependent methyltransferase|nr:class I SAM-dependent methyltransferase [Candidatus Dechloromonas phosphoritropha]MBP8787184.1 class I SAM-dependent methyltransferase [Azonexus sp.]MBP9227100.1 class I SAM-dependent methyltransferase [Azonexus sp.]